MSKKSSLEFKDISKRYDRVEALQSISFSIPENSIFGILGANGSGKSTFMKILAGLIYDWSGDIYYKGSNINQKSMLLKRDFGYLIEAPTFYEYLSAKQNLQLLSRISNIENHRIDYVLDLVDLKPEEILYLLLIGDLPNSEELVDLQKDLNERSAVPDYVWDVL